MAAKTNHFRLAITTPVVELLVAAKNFVISMQARVNVCYPGVCDVTEGEVVV